MAKPYTSRHRRERTSKSLERYVVNKLVTQLIEAVRIDGQHFIEATGPKEPTA